VKNRARSSSRALGPGLSWKVGLVGLALIGSDPGSVVAQATAAEPGPEPGYAWVIFGADTVVAEVAGSGRDRSKGLQNREEVPAGTGMLFTFETHDTRTFWMKDTLIDLDLAVLDDMNRITEILTMRAESLELHDTQHVVFMALEVAAGWFAQKGVGVGAQATIVWGAETDR